MSRMGASLGILVAGRVLVIATSTNAFAMPSTWVRPRGGTAVREITGNPGP